MSSEKRTGSGNLVRHLVDGDVNAEFGEIGHDARIEARDRMSGQRELARRAVADRYPQDVIDEVEFDLESCARRTGSARSSGPRAVT